MPLRLRNLCNAARALSQAVEVRLRAVPGQEEHWTCIVSVGSVTLIESSEGPIDVVLDDAARRVKNMSVTMRSHLDEGEVKGGM